MKNNLLILSSIGALLFILGALLWAPERNPGAEAQVAQAVVEGEVQYIDILAKGGYSPEKIRAEANRRTVLRVKTDNTYDCSLALVIPSIGYRAMLPQNGTQEIEVPAEKAVGTVQGLCSMAMYRFEIVFE